MQLRPPLAAFLWIAATAISTGCGTPSSAKLDSSQSHMKVVGLLYGMYESNYGEPPASQERFEAFLQQAPANWEKIASTPQQLLTSPRDAKPLTIVYGKKASTADDPWVVYEAEPVDGSRLMANSRGSVKLVDEQEFQQLIPSSK